MLVVLLVAMLGVPIDRAAWTDPGFPHRKKRDWGRLFGGDGAGSAEAGIN